MSAQPLKAIRLFSIVTCVLSVAACGCLEQQKSDQFNQCRNELSNLVHRIAVNAWASSKDMASALSQILKQEDKADRRELLLMFKNDLLSIQLDRFRLQQQMTAIELIEDMVQSLGASVAEVSKEDGWRVQMELLFWIRMQFDRIKQSEPETAETRALRTDLWRLFMSAWNIYSEEVRYLNYREWLKKHPLYQHGVRREHEIWRKVANGEMDHMWRSIFERCVRDIESTKYSSEFKRHGKTKLEEFCGRPLDSDDIWNIPKVQNRRIDPHKESKDIEVDVEL